MSDYQKKAFPRQREGYNSESQEGMDLRDYFASNILPAIIQTNYFPDLNFRMKQGKTLMQNYAICAYELADAMMEAREK